MVYPDRGLPCTHPATRERVYHARTDEPAPVHGYPVDIRRRTRFRRAALDDGSRSLCAARRVARHHTSVGVACRPVRRRLSTIRRPSSITAAAVSSQELSCQPIIHCLPTAPSLKHEGRWPDSTALRPGSEREARLLRWRPAASRRALLLVTAVLITSTPAAASVFVSLHGSADGRGRSSSPLLGISTRVGRDALAGGSSDPSA